MNILEIGARVAHLRKLLGLTQYQLAEKSGVTQGTLSRVETASHKSLELETVVALAGALGVTTSELIGEKELTFDPKIREVNAAMQRMPEYKKEALVSAARSFIEIAPHDKKAG